MKNTKRMLGFALLVALLSGCATKVAFKKPDYQIATEKNRAGLTAVIDPQTINNTVSVRSWLAGIAGKWNVQPGQMMKDVADTEMPQAFSHYEFSSSYAEPAKGNPKLVVQLSVPSYEFKEVKAKISVRAIAYGDKKSVLMDKVYTEQGAGQGKMALGAFGIQSAINDSSLDAYKKIFARLREDLTHLSQGKKAL